MKNISFILVFSLNILKSQFSYPAEDFLGGGIGYSPMYIKLDSIPGASYLTNIGLNPNEFDDPFVVHGGEGFAHVTGRWRIGGYAGMGGTSVSTIPEIKIFIDENLKSYDSIFAAAGHPNAVFKIDFESLKSLTSGVTKEITE